MLTSVNPDAIFTGRGKTLTATEYMYAHLELLVRDVALSVGGGHGAHEQGPAGQYSELQPCAEAGLLLEIEHIVLVEGPAGHLVAVQGHRGTACTGTNTG